MPLTCVSMGLSIVLAFPGRTHFFQHLRPGRAQSGLLSYNRLAACTDPEGGVRGVRTPFLENHKNIFFRYSF